MAQRAPYSKMQWGTSKKTKCFVSRHCRTARLTSAWRLSSRTMCCLVDEFFSRKSSLRAWTCMDSCLSTSDACNRRNLHSYFRGAQRVPVKIFAFHFSSTPLYLHSIKSLGWDTGFLWSICSPEPKREISHPTDRWKGIQETHLVSSLKC